MWRAAALVGFALALGCGHHFNAAEASHVQATAVATGAPAPDVQLTSTSSATVRLADVLREHAQTVIVFYRGFY